MIPTTLKQICALALTSSLLTVFVTGALAQENAATSLSIGAIKDQVESAAVHVLAKYGDSLSVTDKLVPQQISGDRGSFYTLSRQFTVDTADKGSFGGVSLRYGIKRYDVGLKTDPEAPPRADGKPVIKFDGDKWMHVIPIHFGADADRSLKNYDYLIEAGYIPALYRSGDSCFKLGANPIVGLSAQVGHRTRDPVPTALVPNPEKSGGLRRLKLEGKLDFALSCLLRTQTAAADQSNAGPLSMIFGDIGNWRIILSSTGWHDFSESRNYKKHEFTIRIPTSGKTSIDLKRDVGAAPTNFNTGAAFSANLNIEF